MTSWRGAKILFQHEMRRSWIGLLGTMVFFTYVSIVMMPIFKESLDVKASTRIYGGWVILLIDDFAQYGVLDESLYMKYWKSDPFTGKPPSGEHCRLV